MSKNLKNTTILAFAVSLGLWLTVLIDKILLDRAINHYIHTPVFYILIFFLIFTALKEEPSLVKSITNYFIARLKNRRFILLTVLITCSSLVLLFLTRNSVNLSFTLKHLLLYAASISISFPALYFQSEKVSSDNNENSLPLYIILSGLFIAVKIYFIFAYTGNFEDDWYHIVAGSEFFETGKLLTINQYFGSNGYSRGIYMSLLTNLIMLFLQPSVDIAQIAPALIGFINFLLLLTIAKKTSLTKVSTSLFALLYIFNPYVIMNQLFIRFYVFYELFFLIIILFSFYLREKLERNNWKSIIISTLVIAILNLSIYFLTQDRSSILFLLYTFTGVILSLLDMESLRIKCSQLIDKIDKRKTIILTVIAVLIPLYIITFHTSIFERIIDIFSTSTNTGSNRNSLIKLICYTFAPLIFFTVATLIKSGKYSKQQKLLVQTVSFGILLHLAMPKNYQVIRGFAYIWGPWIIVSLISIQDLLHLIMKKIKSKRLALTFFLTTSLGLLLMTLNSYPSNFQDNGPSIIGEVANYEFDNTFKYLNSKLDDKTIAFSAYNVVPNMFYNEVPEYILNLDNTLDNYYFPPEVKHLSSVDEVKKISEETELCFVIRDFSPKLLMNQLFKNYITNEFYLEYQNRGFEIWCERDI